MQHSLAQVGGTQQSFRVTLRTACLLEREGCRRANDTKRKGPKPAVTKGTRVILPVTDKKELTSDKNKWDVRIHHQDGNDITFQVQIPASAQVGIWKCIVRTHPVGQREPVNVFKCEDDIYVLFNPWCEEDGVYLEDEQLRQEHVLNETGKVWIGSYRQPKGHRWVFGQFDDVVLPATMFLLELSKLNHADRGSPVQMARAISAMINSLDEDGLIEGNWGGKYEDGIAPHAWTGSVAILEKFLKEGGRPVKYGQCWVFSAVVVTVCRALGIPCRSVTNYVSAHDTNSSLTVDKYFDRLGEEIQGGPDGDCFDSCWNFHVWNELWMARPDLPLGYGGWQIIDATPQEASDAVYRCGPASLEAVRRGEVGFSYDTPFVFAEVNADVCHFKEDESSEWGFSRLSINQYHVGRKIVTKRHDKDDDDGDSDMEDITDKYKNPEGSQAERLAVFNAVRGIERAQQYYSFPKKGKEDVHFDLVEIEKIAFGQNFSVTVHIQNKASSLRTISVLLSASTVFYTGNTAHRLKRANGEFVVQPNQRETLRITVSANEYLDKLVDKSLIKIYAIASVKETNQTWSEEDDFPLQKPKLNIQIRGTPQVGQVCQAVFSFQNPLNIALTDCSFSVEGPGLQRPKIVKHRDVKPGELVTFTEHFRPKKEGPRKILGAFNSKQITEIEGATTVNTRPQ
ncbi:hemocyte protein-glutamine gamma-glutamyltransferase-like isoform X2 [Periplaneta americana]|uniref:hemocyte protein-glutamine gamma-glutamyltransferase-like isoform X2 n=1 Tax=Periplaneta americana TaxID=6978 RepID=UPI0037E95FAB